MAIIELFVLDEDNNNIRLEFRIMQLVMEFCNIQLLITETLNIFDNDNSLKVKKRNQLCEVLKDEVQLNKLHNVNLGNQNKA